MGFSKLDFLGQIASLERRLRGAGLKRPSPCLIRSAPGRHRVCGLSETSEECANFCILGGIRPSYSWILEYAELEQKTHGKIFISKLAFSKLASYFVPATPFSWSHLEAFGLLSYDCCVVAFRDRISRPNPFVRGLSSRGAVLYPTTSLHPVSVRAESSS